MPMAMLCATRRWRDTRASWRRRRATKTAKIEVHRQKVGDNALSRASRPQHICLVCTSNAFIYDDSPTKLMPSAQQGGDMRLRPTGGLMTTYALIRYLKRRYGAERCTIIALDFVFDDAPCVKQWEGHAIVRAPEAHAAAYLRKCGLLSGWDVIVASSLSLEVVSFIDGS